MKMHRNLISVLALAVAGTCLFAAGAAAAAGPVISVPKTTVDFGKIMHGQKTTVLFPFKNTGKATLLVTKVFGTCGCTEASATKTRLAPGQSADVKVIFDSKNYVGPIRKSVYISTNDVSNPSVRLHITGTILTVAQMNPPMFDAGTLKVGTSTQTTVTITPTNRKFKILRIDSKNSQVKVLNKKMSADGVWTATIKVSAGTVPGRLQENLSIVTDLAGVPPLKYLVYGNTVKELDDTLAP